MMIYKPSAETVGRLFVGPDGQLYRQIGYCEQPSVTLENVFTGKRTGGAVGSLHVQQFETVHSLNYADSLEALACEVAGRRSES